MSRNITQPHECHVDPVSYWATQGGSGWLNILRQQQAGGVIFLPQVERDLIFLHSILGNIIAVNQGRQPDPLPGGASGSIARHFSP